MSSSFAGCAMRCQLIVRGFELGAGPTLRMDFWGTKDSLKNLLHALTIPHGHSELALMPAAKAVQYKGPTLRTDFWGARHSLKNSLRSRRSFCCA